MPLNAVVDRIVQAWANWHPPRPVQNLHHQTIVGFTVIPLTEQACGGLQEESLQAHVTLLANTHTHFKLSAFPRLKCLHHFSTISALQYSRKGGRGFLFDTWQLEIVAVHPDATGQRCIFGEFFMCGHYLQAENQTQGLDPKEWRRCKLLHKEKVNHDSVKLRVGFDDGTSVSGLTTASCLLLRAPIGSQKDDGTRANVIRPYTPISDSETRFACTLGQFMM